MRKSVLPYANNKSAIQPAHPRSLIITSAVRCLDSIIPLVMFYIQNFNPLPSFCGCADRLESTLVAKPGDRFSRDVAHLEMNTIKKDNIPNF